MSLLEINNLSSGYGNKQVLFDVSLGIEEGNVVLLIGSNGSGKSTLLKAICGITPVWSGSNKYDGLTLSDVIRKSFISTVIALILAIVMLIIKAWPGCLVSAGVLLFAIATAVYGIVVRAMDMEEPIGVDSEKDKKKAVGLLNHLLNIVILWGYFFFIVGVVCVFISWWAVLIAEIIGVVGALFLLAVGLEIVNG